MSFCILVCVCGCVDRCGQTSLFFIISFLHHTTWYVELRQTYARYIYTHELNDTYTEPYEHQALCSSTREIPKDNSDR